MVVGRNNGVVRLTGFSDKKMSGLLFGPQKSGHINEVVVWRGSTVHVCTIPELLSALFNPILIGKHLKVK